MNGLTGAGSFTVNGAGGLCDSTHVGPSDCPGGTIQGSSLRGPEPPNAANVTLKNMYFKGDGTTNSGATCFDDVNAGSNLTCNAALYLSSASATRLDRLYLDGTGGSADMGLNGNAVNGLTMSNSEIANFGGSTKTAMLFQNLTGTVGVTAAKIHNNNGAHNVFITNNTGTANITFTNPIIQTSSGVTDGIQVDSYLAGTETLNVTATGVTINNVPGNGVSGSATAARR